MILMACGGTAPASPAAAGPPFDPIGFFVGHTQSRGVLEDRSGAPAGQIVTESEACIDANHRLHMVQQLNVRDDKPQKRIWTVWRTAPGRFAATASDMIGRADGEMNGGIFHWRWVLARSPGNPLLNVTMEQWMYRLDGGSAVIRTTISKFGFIAAEATEYFTHPADEAWPGIPAAVPGAGAAALAACR